MMTPTLLWSFIYTNFSYRLLEGSYCLTGSSSFFVYVPILLLWFWLIWLIYVCIYNTVRKLCFRFVLFGLACVTKKLNISVAFIFCLSVIKFFYIKTNKLRPYHLFMLKDIYIYICIYQSSTSNKTW